jgi:hypothetical protein
MLPSLYGPKIFRASPEKDFFDSIDPKYTFDLFANPTQNRCSGLFGNVGQLLTAD